jgi:large subunit ribosomal protein L54
MERELTWVIGALSKKAAKKAARKAAKKAAKLGQFVQEEVVPVNEQTIDLPIGDVVEASVARQELTKAMRLKRRASIKESNFLKTMR